MITFKDEFLTSREDVGEGLEERFEVSDGGIGRERNRYRSSAKLDVHVDSIAVCLDLLHFCVLRCEMY